MSKVDTLVDEIRHCSLCQQKRIIPAANPILQVSRSARIAVFGQAPGNLAHQAGKPFADPSGVRLRNWMNVTEEEFYDASRIAVVPMAFCFPGYDGKSATGKGGDLPPPALCAETWRSRLMDLLLPQLELVLLIGNYAQKWHLGDQMQRTLTDTVRNWQVLIETADRADQTVFIPLPHPSWRNNSWLKKNLWFERELLPEIQVRIRQLMA